MSEPFSAKQKCLEELMRAGRHAYAIPLYQRRYVWNAEENRTLWEDVINCYLSRSNHFLGSFVLMDYVRDDYDQKYQADVLVDETYTVRHVVDGQQRMTSLSILLAALYRDMVENDSYFSTLPGKDNQDEQDWDTLKAKMRDCLITDVRDRESKSHKGYIPRLIPGKSVYEEYKRMANLEGLGKPRLLIEKAYDLHLQSIKRFRHEQIPEMGEGAEERSSVSASRLYSFYNQMYLSIANRIKIIRIICSAEEDAFQVFESLNGTGIRLTSADRIKNMLMGKGSKERDPVPASAIEADWQELAQLVGSNSNIESFLRAFLFTVKGQRVSRTELAKVFTNDYLPEFASVRDALSRLKHAAVLFGAIVNQSEYISKNGERKPLSNDTGMRTFSCTHPTAPRPASASCRRSSRSGGRRRAPRIA